MYSSCSRGFRALTLVENSQSKTLSIQTASDPLGPFRPGVPQSISELTNDNPNLQPERAKNYNIGFQLSPDTTTGFGFDFYKIKINNAIGTGPIQDEVNANSPATVIRNPDGTIAYVDTTYANLGTLTTDGFEVTYRKSVGTSVGTFTLSGDVACVWHFPAVD
jgi:iron complex outermembrane receptor protein